ncbi:hypothetical protein CWE09_10090 [Aliidiomarina minuta]|uniref:Uncharacterized protein n=1 Tax=Aliidiomarina minuta TaxID=880057 RepID=A0A432WBP7_9GAMM|nr:hypothetical protein [Aliidiomarina minuta]RUO27018.1 hypothetical protein CWE09_10090 [Aliidiomarina minuta]
MKSHNEDEYRKPPVTPSVDWQYPSPSGGLDLFIGPGASKAELCLQFLPTLVLAFAMTGWAGIKMESWSWWQFIVFWILLVDMIGGVITNATASAKRWYHRYQIAAKDHLLFVALHAIQPLLIVILFAPENPMYFVVTFGWLLVGALMILKCAVYLQRPCAGAWVVAGILLEQAVLDTPEGFEWFFAVYLIKVLMSHLLLEAPYKAN